MFLQQDCILRVETMNSKKSMKKAMLGLLMSVSILGSQAHAADAPLPVVTSFSILGDIVKQVGGNRVSVDTIVGPDQDSHVYEVTPNDLKKVMKSKLVVVNGLGLEGWMPRMMSATNYKGEVLVASNGIEVRKVEEEHDAASEEKHDHDHGELDPHVWQNPLNVIVYVKNIETELAKLDPAGAETYHKNGDAYINQLKELDQWVVQQFAQIPEKKRVIITSHDAFNYFGERYGVRVLAAQGVSEDSEPSAKGVAELIRQIKAEKIKAVFVENMNSPRLVQQISKEAGVKLGGELYADALSPAKGDAPTYLKMIQYNVKQLVREMKLN